MDLLADTKVSEHSTSMLEYFDNRDSNVFLSHKLRQKDKPRIPLPTLALFRSVCVNGPQPGMIYRQADRLRHWDRDFKSRSGHGCLSVSLYVVLSCVDTGLTTN